MPTQELSTLGARAASFIGTAREIWKTYSDIDETLEPVRLVGDAFDRAARAAAGVLTGYDPNVERLRVFVAAQHETLSALARKDENYWVAQSGANLFDRAAMQQARAKLDAWIEAASDLKAEINAILPFVIAARTVVSNRFVAAVRDFVAESTLPEIDQIVLGDIIGNLNNSVTSLDLINKRLRNCRAQLR